MLSKYLRPTFTEIPVQSQSASNNRGDQQQCDDTCDSYNCDSTVTSDWSCRENKDQHDIDMYIWV